MKYLMEGLLLGLAYVAPIGVQNLFVINTAATKTLSKSYQTALIVIFFDVTLALGCFFGVGTLMVKWEVLKLCVLFFGSLAVCWIGISLLRSRVKEVGKAEVEKTIPQIIATACLVTWFNPQALIDGSLMLGAFRASLDPQHSAIFIIGVCTASFLWFMSVTTAIGMLKHKIGVYFLNIVNKVCGAVIILYGIKLAISFISEVMR
jgi:L-lysine exporter family protein LysE/ArgO